MAELENRKNNINDENDEKFDVYVMVQNMEVIKKYKIIAIISGVTWALTILIGAWASLSDAKDSTFAPFLVIPVVHFVTIALATNIRRKRKDLNSSMKKIGGIIKLCCLVSGLIIVGVTCFLGSITFRYRKSPRTDEIIATVQDLYGVDSQIIDTYIDKDTYGKRYIGEYEINGEKSRYCVCYSIDYDGEQRTLIGLATERLNIIKDECFEICSVSLDYSTVFETRDGEKYYVDPDELVYSMAIETSEEQQKAVAELRDFSKTVLNDEALSKKYSQIIINIFCKDRIDPFGEPYMVLELNKSNVEEELDKLEYELSTFDAYEYLLEDIINILNK